jgi:hypothetical protein
MVGNLEILDVDEVRATDSLNGDVMLERSSKVLEQDGLGTNEVSCSDVVLLASEIAEPVRPASLKASLPRP